MVYAPAIDVLYLAERGKAWKEEKGVRQAIGVSNAHPPLVVVSRSHIDDELKDYLQQLGEHQTVSVGSSLKFCLVAEGKAQLYPRFGPTNIWDTAAGHAVAVAAGAQFTIGRASRCSIPRVNLSSTPASGCRCSELVRQQLVQLGHHLLHLFRRQRAVFGELNAPLLIQHHNS